MKKQPLLWMTIAAALLSGCTGHREHHPQVTFTVDTVRTDTTASNPICLEEKYGSLLNERHPDLFAGAQGSISRSAFFNDSLTLTPETLHGMIQNTPCVESLVTSVGPDTFTADVSPVSECRYHRIFTVRPEISLCDSRPQTRNENRLLNKAFLSDRNSPLS